MHFWNIFMLKMPKNAYINGQPGHFKGFVKLHRSFYEASRALYNASRSFYEASMKLHEAYMLDIRLPVGSASVL